MINRSLASGSQQCLDQRIAFPLPRRASYCFSWTRKPRESDCAQFQSIPAFHRPSQVRPPGWLRMQWPWPLCFGADRCKSLRQFLVPERTSRGTIGSKAISSRCESRQTGPVGACSWLCECTQPVRCRSLNAKQRGRTHTAGTASGPLACLYGRCQA